MRIVVAGAAGFVGSHCMRTLRQRGHEAFGFVRPQSKSPRFAELEVDFPLHQVDLGERDAVGSALRAIKPDGVINAAWYAEPTLYLHDLDRNIDSLKVGLVLLQSVVKEDVPHIVLAGSCLEAVHTGTNSIYAQAKRCLHDVALASAVQAHVTAACAHIFSPYGPHEHPNRAVPSVIRSLLRGNPISVTSAEAFRDYIHISDVSSGLVTLVETALGGVFDVCTGSSTKLKDVFSTIASEIDRPELLQWGQAEVGPGESFDAFGNPVALLNLGWVPQFDLATGIRDAVNFWRSEAALMEGNLDHA